MKYIMDNTKDNAVSWQEYQIQTADLFKSIGCKVDVEAKIKGVRGEHEVDVYVTFEQHSIKCVWIVECKYWNTNIPKEKVLALQSIVSDIGADRGIIVSKTGFQSGAIRSAENSNITLTSLEDLKVDLSQDLTKQMLNSLEVSLLNTKSRLFSLARTEKVGDGVWRSKYPVGVDHKSAIEHVGLLCILEDGFSNFKLGKDTYPIGCTEDSQKIRTTKSIEEFLQAIQEQLQKTNDWLEETKANID